MAPPALVDTHVHLDDTQFDGDRAEVLERARIAGVTAMVHVGYRPDLWEGSLLLCDEHPDVVCALGVHPGDAHEATDHDLDRLAELVCDPRVVAVGEVGVDRYWTSDTLPAQLEWFRRQLELARTVGKPVVVHQRAAAAEVLDVLSDADPDVPVVLHSFDGDPGLARLARERGYLLGVGGLMTRAASGDLRGVLRDVPVDQLVLETDAPYLVPTGTKARRNEPAFLPSVLARLAEVRGSDPEELACSTTANARRYLLRPSEVGA